MGRCGFGSEGIRGHGQSHCGVKSLDDRTSEANMTDRGHYLKRNGKDHRDSPSTPQVDSHDESRSILAAAANSIGAFLEDHAARLRIIENQQVRIEAILNTLHSIAVELQGCATSRRSTRRPPINRKRLI